MNCDICGQPCEDYYVGMSCIGITIMCAQCYNGICKGKRNRDELNYIPTNWLEERNKEWEELLEPTVSPSNTDVIYDIIINSED